MRACGQFTFQETAYEESQFLMQLTADTGELYRTSSADAFMVRTAETWLYG